MTPGKTSQTSLSPKAKSTFGGKGKETVRKGPVMKLPCRKGNSRGGTGTQEKEFLASVFVRGHSKQLGCISRKMGWGLAPGEKATGHGNSEYHPHHSHPATKPAHGTLTPVEGRISWLPTATQEQSNYQTYHREIKILPREPSVVPRRKEDLLTRYLDQKGQILWGEKKRSV